MTRGERRVLWVGLAFISPWIIGFLTFTVYPLAAALYYSFCDYDILSNPVWVGTLNYRDLVADHVFWRSLYNTLRYATFFLPLGMLLSLLVAILLTQSIKGRSVFRLTYFLPCLVPVVASAMIWLWMFNSRFGLLNRALAKMGIDGPNWLTDPHWAMPSLILMSLWGIGNMIVIYLATLHDVPKHIYESTDMDGASFGRKLWHITVPMISPVIYFNLIMGLIGSLQVFVQPYIMVPDGGINRSALFYTVYLYEHAFSYLNMGYASAMACILFLLIFFLTWMATCSIQKRIYYAGE
ncbi:MAG: ABC transporter permease subunit [Kiritimatiellae bacterium]|nr:ABC transporter permease subunit [Kiritimatiellia bacterium]